MDIFSFLESIHKVSDQARVALQNIINVNSYKKNEIVQDIGSRCKTIYFVKDGCARIFYYKDGNDITEHFAFENELIVRAESLFTGKPTSKGIQAIDKSTILSIDSESLFQLYNQYHDIERLFRLLFEKEYVNTVKRIENLQFMSAKERYAELLKTTDYVQKIPLKYIATYLGITQVSLSRIRADVK
ncbi:MAG: cyclic nucleotide-binding protein [Sphingobacteriales bacterium 17-39-43]|uniref:Crp/Fnr family transcriptional regulator n=1 Tax=Daejeonella sp. TaxID=2805397 RepID=UPI000BD2D770|nr:Crp/Fnr family transcriptional regulator [Daejeonella sp.]OYZ28468.1 MAG: cyclic nucleotide-binding protein [Sphingobacteriales bacterium 16-39-50]OZA22331.1 MAG: cyclic nucleotide-binding protein [Sphingobacteriales bacterium 17-39-43]HQT24609.1 Crp/Fnr family transcriptional regulator [Daejeonella sp.]HQT59378.1 Crp/Fnr family transcriptional regulator [Daejeonella sp.]